MNKTMIIAEVGINHNGNIELAKKLIDVASAAGCDAVKFQKRDIESCYTSDELNAPRKSPWGTTNREQKHGLEFGRTDYDEIDKYCERKQIQWFASPWDLISINFLERYDSPFIKVPSARINDIDFMKSCKNTDKGVIISSGMSDWTMVDRAVHTIEPLMVMQCTSTYPSQPSELNLSVIQKMCIRYPLQTIGFSNHNAGVIYMPIAVALGAKAIEFHITLDRAMYGSDQAASIEPEGVFKLVKYIRGVEQAMGNGEKFVYPSEAPIAAKLRR